MELQPDQFAKALADLTRLRIIVLLVADDEHCVCQLRDALKLEQPKISRHLAVLRSANIVQDRREGQWIHYRIHPDLPRWAYECLASLRLGTQGKEPYQSDVLRLRNQVEADSSCLS